MFIGATDFSALRQKAGLWFSHYLQGLTRPGWRLVCVCVLLSASWWVLHYPSFLFCSFLFVFCVRVGFVLEFQNRLKALSGVRPRIFSHVFSHDLVQLLFPVGFHLKAWLWCSGSLSFVAGDFGLEVGCQRHRGVVFFGPGSIGSLFCRQRRRLYLYFLPLFLFVCFFAELFRVWLCFRHLAVPHTPPPFSLSFLLSVGLRDDQEGHPPSPCWDSPFYTFLLHNGLGTCTL